MWAAKSQHASYVWRDWSEIKSSTIFWHYIILGFGFCLGFTCLCEELQVEQLVFERCSSLYSMIVVVTAVGMGQGCMVSLLHCICKKYYQSPLSETSVKVRLNSALIKCQCCPMLWELMRLVLPSSQWVNPLLLEVQLASFSLLHPLRNFQNTDLTIMQNMYSNIICLSFITHIYTTNM